MNYSIKRFLLIYITLATLVIYALISLASYWVSKVELDELYDTNLQQVATAIAAQHLAIQDTIHLYRNNQVGSGTKIEREEEFYVRVLARDGTVLYVSHPEVKVPLSSSLGLFTQISQGKQWRFFVVNAKEETIQVAQSLRLRKDTINETAYSLMASQLLFIPVLVLLIFFAISKALLPLSILTKEIQFRNSDDLNPFADDKVPSEIKPLVKSLNVFMCKVSFMVGVLKRFTSDAAHELRTPITALKLQLTVLEQAKSIFERESAIQNLKAGINRSEKLVSQLLTLARLEPGNQSRQIRSFDLLALVKESFEELLPLAQEKYIDLGLIKAEQCEVFGVQQEIKVMINNVLDNAIRYTPNGGKIDVSVFNQAGNIVLEVKDSGLGIPQNDIEHVFERFYRGENQNIAGSGLGLSIVKEIASQHSATIELSNLNPGLSFKVFFAIKSVF
ncbi:ATP-binding protein [Hydrogenophaga sp.]|jgi:signal transduction histidine kinase|uniref:ATP-binding protein n=1 Tax=Hydrogenophaga sp. TaxID=1904254 RepID=UPI0027346E35|nr:ATP-binding protein [Hydrogenophaga sp.]MDP1958978.1 ATP-binding protein [Methylotenera sp.]MDP3885464.1 ATP-binding protein [Hydrogenophaga sp.]